MTITEYPLAPRLVAALPQVLINAEQNACTIGDREISAARRGELEPQLAEQLYAVFHTGMPDPGLSKVHLKPTRWLELAMAEVVPHTSTPVAAVFREDGGQRLLVEWDGVLVWLPRYAAGNGRLPPVGDPIPLLVPPARPGLSPGFLLATGSVAPDFTGPPLRVYVHLTDADDAIAAWQSTLIRLEQEQVGYQAKVLVRAGQYPRRDAMVVYLPPDSADAARLVTDAVRDASGLGHTTSLFAERLAPGVAKGWEPTDRRFGWSGLSFGLHRCKVLARALLDSAATGEPRESTITTAFLAAGIDPENPALNIEQDE
jgi:hypothetical protein